VADKLFPAPQLRFPLMSDRNAKAEAGLQVRGMKEETEDSRTENAGSTLYLTSITLQYSSEQQHWM
jgi:hypothetical protein